jgi:hypothetical protein
LALLRLEILERRCLPSIFTVTTTADSGPGSLRQAILDANGHVGLDAIHFAIGSGVRSIAPLSPLPAITDSVDLDATTQPGYAGTPIVQLDGIRAGPQADGLTILTSISRVRGLVINRFAGAGIRLAGSIDTLDGNYIGTDVTGTIDLGNGGDGILVTGLNNIVGGSASDARNVISGNALAGIRIAGQGAVSNHLFGDWIGVTAEGNAPLGNHEQGVVVDDAPANDIGMPGFGAVNVISGNLAEGIVLRGSSTTISSTVAYNLVGTDSTGTVALGNQGAGVVVDGIGAFIGDTLEGSGNVISGNGGPGIAIVGVDGPFANVLNNRIGTDVDGTFALGNQGPGVLVASGSATIGFAGAFGGNVISGNLEDGIHFAQDASPQCQVINNRIGTTADGTAALGNGGNGVVVEALAEIIGGVVPNSGNVISGNGGDGVRLTVGAAGTAVIGNLIGVNSAGDQALGNLGSGVSVVAPNCIIGLTSVGAGNVISGNGGDGVTILGASNGRIWHNLIGTDVTGTNSLGNCGNGVLIGQGSSDNVVGGFPEGANVVAFNGGTGVVVGLTSTDLALRNSVRANAIYSNGGLGIDLGNDGVTPNHDGGPLPGPNHLRNYPIITVAEAGPVTHVTGTLDSRANGSFVLDFYASTDADPSGYGQGQRFLGWAIVLTDVQGHGDFDVTVTAPTEAGEVLTATANDLATGDTSEFSQAVPLVAPVRGLKASAANAVPVSHREGWAVELLQETERRLRDSADNSGPTSTENSIATPPVPVTIKAISGTIQN